MIATVHSSDDGDIDLQLTLDPPFTNLNNANITKLNGHLQIEAICAPRGAVPAARVRMQPFVHA